MRLYRATAFLFPRHYTIRMFLLCFLAVHMPLLAFLGFEVTRGAWHWQTFAVLLGATVVGSTFAIAALAADARTDLPQADRTETLLRLRYDRTDSLFDVPLADLPTMRADFLAQHRARFGFEGQGAILIDMARVEAIAATQEAMVRASAGKSRWNHLQVVSIIRATATLPKKVSRVTLALG